MKCPYPDCQQESPDALFKAGKMCCCRYCHRFSWTCQNPNCHAQNRLFSRFCRRCKPREAQTDAPKVLSPGLGQWLSSGSFPTDWYFGHPTNTNVVTGEVNKSSAPDCQGTPVVELGLLDGFDLAANVLLEMTMVDGLLALHQGGGTLAVVQPFGDKSQPHPVPVVTWSMAESELVPRPAIQDTHAATFRPYAPITSQNRRYLVFSTPYAVLALDLWNLPGSATGPRVPNCRLVFQSLEETGPRLAAQPVPFGGATDAFGLLLKTSDGRYLWKIVELASLTAGRSTTPNAEFLKNAVDLKLQGSPCQVAVVEDAFITFATPFGHWLWTQSAALKRDAQELPRQTRSVSGQHGEFGLDKHVSDRSAFRYPRQALTLDRDNDTKKPLKLTWFYPLLEDNSLEWYSINLSDQQAPRPRKSPAYPKAEPLGRRGLDLLPEMLFRAADRCLRLAFGQDELHSIGELHLRTGQVVGFEYHAPLLMTVFLDPRTPRKWQIDLLSVSTRLSAQTAQLKDHSPAGNHQRQVPESVLEQAGNDRNMIPARLDPRRLTLDQIDLIAMPMIWSRWLFTLERRESKDSRETQFVLVRRELPVHSIDELPGPEPEPVNNTERVGPPVIKW